MDKALSNITVLDLTRVLAGPYCTMMLADYGANVIKIEVPGKGDDTRAMGPKKNDYSMYYAYVNRGKKGITLNLKEEEGKKMFIEMVKKADVVVENYRPGVMDKLGLGYDVLKEVNDQIIYAAVSGFGCYGPKYKRPGYDIIAQATSGLMSITGEPDGEPLRVGTAIGDVLAHSEFREIQTGGGVDHYFLVDGTGMRPMADVYCPATGIAMRCASDAPGILVYTGNGLERESGKGGAIYRKNWAVCLETERFPNAVNIPALRNTALLKPDEQFASATEYTFSIQ